MKVLLLRLEADIVSFTRTVTDQHHITDFWPRRSLIVGFIANALGISTRQPDGVVLLEGLQQRLSYAVRCDRQGSKIVDFHTTDHSLPHVSANLMAPNGWIRGAQDKEKTMVGNRERLCGSSYLVALALTPGNPSLEDVVEALQAPKRALCVGTLVNVITKPPYEGTVEAASLLQALEDSLPAGRIGVPAVWPEHEGRERPAHLYPITEDRDWVNDIMVGYRLVREGTLRVN